MNESVASGRIMTQTRHTCMKKHMSQQLPGHPQPVVPKDRGPAVGWPEKGQGWTVVFDCLVVSLEMPSGDMWLL